MGIHDFIKSLSNSNLIARQRVAFDHIDHDSTRGLRNDFEQESESYDDENHDTSIMITVDKNRKKLRCRRLYIDFNSVLHIVFNKIENDVRYVQYAKLIDRIDDRCRMIVKRLDPSYDIDKHISDEELEEWCIEFKKHICSILSDDYILESVKECIEYIIDNLVTSDTVEYIYIAIDGVPNMAKIVEQKKKRAMTYILNGLKKRATLNLKGTLPIERQIFESCSFIFDRSRISPVGDFMDRLYLYLNTSEFQDSMRVRYTSLKSITIDDHRRPGEGEIKIMNDIISSRYIDYSVIFSPDSDVVVMSIMIRNMLNRKAALDAEPDAQDDIQENDISKQESDKINNYLKTHTFCNIGMIKYNTTDKDYEYIMANELSEAIFRYVQSKTTLELDEDRVTNDICFILTFLGNDYLPKWKR